MGLSRSEQLVLVLLSVAILAGRFARDGCGERQEFEVIHADAREDSARSQGGLRDGSHAESTGAHGMPGTHGALDDSALSGSAQGAATATRDGASLDGGIARGTRAGGADDAPKAASPAQPIDLNRATLEELVTLPGIGPAKAKAILERRSEVNGFRKVEDLLEVPGIGAKTLERLASLVFVASGETR